LLTSPTPLAQPKNTTTRYKLCRFVLIFITIYLFFVILCIKCEGVYCHLVSQSTDFKEQIQAGDIGDGSLITRVDEPNHSLKTY
jgi:hypothetical protein